jgi:hypothetical protein
MMSPLKTYDPAKVTVTIGPFLLTGFAENTSIEVAPNQAERWSLAVGVGGAKSRAKNHNRSTRTTIHLQQTSPSNDVLTGLEKTGQALPLVVRDLSGRSLFVGGESYVLGPPTASYGDTITNRDWIIESAEMIDFHGGN